MREEKKPYSSFSLFANYLSRPGKFLGKNKRETDFKVSLVRTLD